MIAGLQYAGGHLKELQKAMKNPALNFGVIVGEGAKRARKAVGLSQDAAIDGVHPALSNSAVLLSKVTLLSTRRGKGAVYHTVHFT